MWHSYCAPSTVGEALELLAKYGDVPGDLGRHRPDSGTGTGVRSQEILVDVSAWRG